MSRLIPTKMMTLLSWSAVAAEAAASAAVTVSVDETRADNNIIIYTFNLLSLSIYLLSSLLSSVFSLLFGGSVQ